MSKNNRKSKPGIVLPPIRVMEDEARRLNALASSNAMLFPRVARFLTQEMERASVVADKSALRDVVRMSEQEVQPDAAAAGGAAKEPTAETKPRADLTGQGTILLVEDEEGLRSLNARGLRSRGYSVIEASNGVEAMEALEQKDGAVDLVVSDVVMPEMDGPTLLKAMRGRNPDLRIIFVSGYAEDAFDKSLPENQQFAFLPKPFTLSQLVAAVKETMAPS